MSNIRLADIGKDISLTPKEIIMRDQKPVSVANPKFNIIVNLHPTGGTHCVLVIRRKGDPVYYFDSFGVMTPPLFLEEYVDLGSNERLQEYDESCCGAYCLYRIYLFDKGFRMKSVSNILTNECKNPGTYDVCCKDKGIDSEDEVDIYLLRENSPLVKPRSRVSPLQIAGHGQRSNSGTASQIDVNGSLQSWLDDDNIIVNASFPESFRCVIAGPSECGKTF